MLAVVGVLAILIVSGVVEVRIHPDRIANVPAALTAATKDQTLVERGRRQLIALKRSGEQLIVRDQAKRLELAILYVKEDAKRLQSLLTAHKDNSRYLLPQAELLLASIEQVRTQAQEAPVKVVADLKEESREAFTLAYQAYADIKELREEYAALQKEFARLTSSLEEQIGALTTQDKEGSVAGTKEESKQSQPSKIPLKF